MGFTDNKISSLAKALEPYFRQYIREILGNNTSDGEDYTWVQGGYFDRVDISGVVGQDAVQLSTDQWWWETNEQPQAARSLNLGSGCKTLPDATDSIAFGWNGINYKNPCSVSAGYTMYDIFESQGVRYTESAKVTMTSSWQTIATLNFRGYMHEWAYNPQDEWNTAGIHASISGIEIGAVRSYAYSVIATTKMRNGVMTLLQDDVTTMYEDDANFDLQVVVRNPECFDFQVKDSGDSGRSVKWCIHVRTAEAIGHSGVTQDSDMSSVSVSVSPSISVSASPSFSESPSVSVSVSPSLSESISVSPSISPSASVSVGISHSSSYSLSDSPSASVSVSVSPSVSISVSPSISPSVSVSVSPSVSPSGSVSPSSSVSPSVSPSVSQSFSVSPSVSPSGSVSLSVSPSSSVSESVSPSYSVSPSISPSSSESVSASPSEAE